ncbi:MAG: leucine-rich repeat protein [Bacteroidales bacterium]|nr:leucine-rich repeat protein [Bacteroidales bacterium]
MKKFLVLFFIAFLSINFSWAYDFSAVAPSGQTLYYTISGTNATVTYPNASADLDDLDPAVWGGFAKPTGALVIPSSVTHNSQTYAVTAIGTYAFYECRGITSVVIHDSLTTIGEAAFAYCPSITEVTIGEGLVHLGMGAFIDCRALTHVTFNAVNCTTNSSYMFEYYDSINYTFSSNNNLTDVEFGSNVQRIPGRFLAYCEGISTITIPATVTVIGTRAFFGCNGMEEIIALPTTAPQVESRAFDGMAGSVVVYVPCGSTASYMSGWTDFSNFVEENTAFVLSAFSADEEMGEVEITAQPDCSSPVAVVQAVAHEGYLFAHWSNGETANPYALTLTCDSTVTAIFEADMPAQYTVTAEADDATMGTVTGAGTYDEGTVVTLTATPNEGFRFVRWSNGETENPYSFTLTCDSTVTAIFEADMPAQYTVTAEADDATMGTVTGAGTYDEGTVVTLTATPNEGFRFVRWSNGETENPYSFTLTCDTLISALFEPIQTESIQEADGATIRQHNGHLTISGAEGMTISIFDLTGRILVNETLTEGKTYEMPHAGVYMVRVGNHSAKKVVVAK